MGLTTTFGAGLCPPGGNRIVQEPDNEIAPLTRTGVEIRPGCHPALLFGYDDGE